MGEMADYLLEQADADVDGVLEAPRKTGGSKRHIHQQTNGGAKPKLKMCEQCGIHPADLPSTKCCGCNSYDEHF
jgi:hypothetical protein